MDFITSKFIPNYTDYQDKDVKRDYIKLSAFLRIFFLFIAFLFYLLSGLMTTSILLIILSVNIVIDIYIAIKALMVYAKLGKDKQERSKFQKIEVFTELGAMAVIILVGIELLIASLKRVINATTVKMSVFALILCLVSIGLELFLHLWHKRYLKKLKSKVFRDATENNPMNMTVEGVLLVFYLILAVTQLKVADGILGIIFTAYIFFRCYREIRYNLLPALRKLQTGSVKNEPQNEPQNEPEYEPQVRKEPVKSQRQQRPRRLDRPSQRPRRERPESPVEQYEEPVYEEPAPVREEYEPVPVETVYEEEPQVDFEMPEEEPVAEPAPVNVYVPAAEPEIEEPEENKYYESFYFRQRTKGAVDLSNENDPRTKIFHKINDIVKGYDENMVISDMRILQQGEYLYIPFNCRVPSYVTERNVQVKLNLMHLIKAQYPSYHPDINIVK